MLFSKVIAVNVVLLGNHKLVVGFIILVAFYMQILEGDSGAFDCSCIDHYVDINVIVGGVIGTW